VRRGRGGACKALAMAGNRENGEHSTKPKRDRLDLPCSCNCIFKSREGRKRMGVSG